MAGVDGKETAIRELIERLERAADELRTGELAPEEAAELVERVARLASEAAGELDRAVRAEDASQGQLELE
jgi:polyhydroxyalkanoate synthesis regulator phasin